MYFKPWFTLMRCQNTCNLMTSEIPWLSMVTFHIYTVLMQCIFKKGPLSVWCGAMWLISIESNGNCIENAYSRCSKTIPVQYLVGYSVFLNWFPERDGENCICIQIALELHIIHYPWDCTQNLHQIARHKCEPVSCLYLQWPYKRTHMFLYIKITNPFYKKAKV